MFQESSTPFPKLKVFILGATGYIGGEILFKLLILPEFSQFEITALSRTTEKAQELLKKTDNRIKTLIGTLDDTELLTEELKKSDIVINAADVDNVTVAKTISNVATSIKKPFLILHTSGTSVLGDGLSPTKSPAKVYSDLKDNQAINSLPLEQPHRPVDEIILNIQEQNPEFVKTVLVAPPAIFGENDGYINRESVQIPLLIKLAVKNGQVFSVYSGNYQWSHVHVDDLADLYIILLKKLLKGDSDIKTGKEGYYFAENGVHYWKDISARIGKLLKERGLIKTDQVAQLDPDAIRKLADIDFAPYYWGTNSISKAELAKEYGWEPKFGTYELLHEVEYCIERFIKGQE